MGVAKRSGNLEPVPVKGNTMTIERRRKAAGQMTPAAIRRELDRLAMLEAGRGSRDNASSKATDAPNSTFDQ